MITDQEIYDEIETHTDNGVSPHFVAKLVAEVLDIPLARVKKVLKLWLSDAGFSV